MPRTARARTSYCSSRINPFPVIDEERCLVWSFVRFDHAGKDQTITCNDGSVHPVNIPFDEPFSFQICELVKSRDGELLQIEALVTLVRSRAPVTPE